MANANHLTASEITSLNTRNIVKIVADIDNLDLLREARENEQGKDRPRKTALGALEMRIDTLLAAQDDADTDTDTDVSDEPTSEVPDVVSIVTSPTTEPEPTEPEPEPEPAATALTDTEACAKAFLAALADGDKALVATMIAQVRQDNADDEAMADALVGQFKAAKAARRTRTRTRKGGVSAKVLGMVEAAINAAQRDESTLDGSILITRAHMDEAGMTKSYRKSVPWTGSGRARRAARSIGYTTSTCRIDGDFAVKVDPIKNEVE